jgi:D-alanyl-D-alanine dipeptidase
MLEICHTRQAYAQLTREQRLYTYLVEDAAAEVPTRENGEPLIDLRDAPGSSILRWHESLTDFHVRSGLAERLVRVGAALHEAGFQLEVYEAFRSYEKQKREFTEISQQISAQHPQLTGKDLWRKITEFIADPDLCPPHSSGGAVDVRLLDYGGSPVSMGTELNEIHERSNLMCADLSEQHKRCRLTLLEAMLSEGFAPLPTEWWHYSYGEKYWGAFYDCDAIYTTVKGAEK